MDGFLQCCIARNMNWQQIQCEGKEELKPKLYAQPTEAIGFSILQMSMPRFK